MKAGEFLGGLIVGAAIGVMMAPRRNRKAVMRRGRRYWAKGSSLLKRSGMLLH